MLPFSRLLRPVKSIRLMSRATSKKRTAEAAGLPSEVEPSTKQLYPIFNRRSPGDSQPEASDSFQWKRNSILVSRTCLYGENAAPEIRSKIAAFDLDRTVIKWHEFKYDSKWEFWHKDVLTALKSAYEDGYTVVLFSNQNISDKKLTQWKSNMAGLGNSLREVPFFIFAATAKDMYRKPMPGMWIALEKMAEEAGIKIDLTQSFFVGDAAGRKGDFSSTDRKFAMNIGLKFQTPEDFFLKNDPEPYNLPGTHISDLYKEDVPHVSPTSTPVLPRSPKKHTEIVLFVGPPAAGKSSFFRNTFSTAGYVHVNQDTLGNRTKCIRTSEESLKKRTSCVIDNTNRDKRTRKYYTDLAKQFNVPIRCFWFKASKELSWHNNLYRAYCLPLLSAEGKNEASERTKLIPYSAIMQYFNDFEEPTIEEGFDEIKCVNWIFEGDDSQRRFWNMWLQIDGK